MRNDFDNSETIQFVCLRTSRVSRADGSRCVQGDVIIRSAGRSVEIQVFARRKGKYNCQLGEKRTGLSS